MARSRKMRDSIKNLIKNSIFIECKLPNIEHNLCKTQYSTDNDFCLQKSSDDSVAQIIYNNIIEYAIGEFDIDYDNLDEEQCRAIAENLKYDEEAAKTAKLRYGFYGEVLLYSLLVNIFSTNVLISKGYFYSPLEKGEPKGFDAYHLIQHNDNVELWFGEAKFRNDYKQPINEVLSNFSKTTSEGYFRDNVLAIVKEKHNISFGSDVVDKLTPITQTWRKNVSINVVDELKQNNIELVYPIMIAYQQPKRSDYYDGVKKCINYINEKFNTREFVVNETFPIKIFFMFFPVDNVKKIKEQVIEWIRNKEPLI